MLSGNSNYIRKATLMFLAFVTTILMHPGSTTLAVATETYLEKTSRSLQDSVRIELEKTNFNDICVLYLTDTAETTEGISKVLGKAYGELMRVAGANGLHPLKFIAWYYSFTPPWPMEIAVQVDCKPAQINGQIKTRVQKGGEVLIAHMRGPYEQVGQAYKKIQTWLKENNRVSKGNPFEVYINDPSSVKSPSEIQTDIYQPLE